MSIYFFNVKKIIAIRISDNPNSDWYKRNTMGINKLYGLVKQMKLAAGIESEKRLTNHR
jgi:hypothetical protein